MALTRFHQLRTAVQVDAHPGSDWEVATKERDLRDLLMASGLFENVEVEHTDNPDQLVVALCRYVPGQSEADVAREIERLWNDRVRYPYWEAHSLIVDKEFIEFEAATRNSDTGHYVTLHMVAEAARIPTQRAPGA